MWERTGEKGGGVVLGVLRSPRAAGRGRLDWAARAHIGGCGSKDFMRPTRETEVGQCGPRKAGRVALRGVLWVGVYDLRDYTSLNGRQHLDTTRWGWRGEADTGERWSAQDQVFRHKA